MKKCMTALLGCFLFGLLVESRVLAHCPTCFGCETCFCPVCVDDDSKCTGCCYLCVDALCLADPLLCSGCCSCTGCQCLDDDSLCLPWVEVCCDCGCEPVCEEVENDQVCSSEYDTLCPGCVQEALDDCSNYEASRGTNAIRYNCWGGCPGDCYDVVPDPVCWNLYFCEDKITIPFAICKRLWPGDPLDCYTSFQPVECTRCRQGGYNYSLPLISMRCK